MALGVTSLALVVYSLTLAPSVTLVDSGELIAAAHQPGVAHPPGFPLYVMLAHAASRVPWGNVAQRLNALSALCAALAAGLLCLVMREATSSGSVARPGPGAEGSWIDLVPPALAGLLLAFSRTFWSYATLTEVYSLNTLLVVLILGLMFRWRRAPEADRPLLVAAGCFGLALGVHHVTVALLLPALAVLVWQAAGSGFFRSRRLAAAAGVALATLIAVYLYLPFAAAHPAGLNWGRPDDFRRLLWHVTGRQYQAFLAPSIASLRGEATALWALLVRELGPVWMPAALALALAGWRALWRRDRPLFATLLCLVLANGAFGLFYTIAEDKDAYSLPTVVAFALAAGFGAQGLLAALPRERRVLVAGLLLVVPGLALASTWRAADRREDRVAERFVADTLRSVAPGGLLLTSEWQLYSPLLYLQQVENRRPDVVAIDLQLLRRSWYFDYLRRRAPELMQLVGAPVRLFLEDLQAWELEPSRYARDRTLNRRIDDRFHDMILELVARQLDRGPVYVTRDVALAPFASDPALPPRLDAGYAFVPRGLVFELRRDRSFVDPGEMLSPDRALLDRSPAIDPDGVVALKVRPVYLTMLASRGFYLAAHGHPAEARAAFLAALELDSSFAPARQALGRLDGR